MYNVCVDLAIVVQRDRNLVLKAAVRFVTRTRGVHVECVRRFVFNAWVVRKPAYLPLACLHVLEAALGEIRLAAKITVVWQRKSPSTNSIVLRCDIFVFTFTFTFTYV